MDGGIKDGDGRIGGQEGWDDGGIEGLKDVRMEEGG